MKAAENVVEYKRIYWLVPIILATISIGSELLYTDSLFMGSLKSITNINKGFDTESLAMQYFFIAIQWASSSMTLIALTVVMYNFMNVYKSFILLSSIFFSNYISTLISLIHLSPRPFMVYSKIHPLFLFNDWGNPSSQITTMITFYITFITIIFQSKSMKKKLWLKIVLIALITLLLSTIIFFHFASGLVSRGQGVYSFLIGITIFSLIFTLLQAEMNKPRQFYSIVKTKILYYFIINAIMAGFIYIGSIFIENSKNTSYYQDNIQQQIELINKRLTQNEINPNFFLSNGSAANIICFSMNFIAILALKLELYLTYEGNYDKWRSANFEMVDKKEEADDEKAFLSDHKYVKGTQWNHTNPIKSFIRFILLVILCGVAYLPWIFFENQGNIYLDFLLRIILPLTYLVFGKYFLFKLILRKLKLTNE